MNFNSSNGIHEEEFDIQDSPIEKLNHDCLIHIFNFLPVVDLIRIEKVSKSWRYVAEQSWFKFKKLRVDPKILGFKPIGTGHRFYDIDDNVLENILMRCGKYLDKIDVSYIDFGCHLNSIAKYCPNIKSIICNKASSYGIRYLSEYCRNITEFKVRHLLRHTRRHEEFEDTLGYLFSKNKNFQVLDIEDSTTITGECLSKLPMKEMVTIRIKTDEFSFSEYLMKTLNKSQNLSVLEFEIS